jgi:hypothetical protein
VANDSDIARSGIAWSRLSWDIQNYILFYLRSHHLPITLNNTNALAQVVEDRLRRGPAKHSQLEVIIERSELTCFLDTDEDG